MKLRCLDNFKNNEKGMLSVDFVIATPLLMTWLFAAVTVFDGFVKYNKTVKATATMSNLISRLETTSNAEIENIYSLYQQIADTDANESAIRVTSINQTADGPVIRWSYAAGNSQAMEAGASELDDLPTIVVGDDMMLLETFRDFKPIVDWEVFPVTTFEITQPFILRFTGKLVNSDFPEEESNYDGSDEPGDPSGGLS